MAVGSGGGVGVGVAVGSGRLDVGVGVGCGVGDKAGSAVGVACDVGVGSGVAVGSASLVDSTRAVMVASRDASAFLVASIPASTVAATSGVGSARGRLVGSSGCPKHAIVDKARMARRTKEQALI